MTEFLRAQKQAPCLFPYNLFKSLDPHREHLISWKDDSDKEQFTARKPFCFFGKTARKP